MVKRWAGRAVTAAIAYVVDRDHGICWLCNHDGANSCDHYHPRSTHPELTWVRTNWRAAHHHKAGHPLGCQHPGCTCIGNVKRQATPPPSAKPSRAW